MGFIHNHEIEVSDPKQMPITVINFDAIEHGRIGRKNDIGSGRFGIAGFSQGNNGEVGGMGFKGSFGLF